MTSAPDTAVEAETAQIAGTEDMARSSVVAVAAAAAVEAVKPLPAALLLSLNSNFLGLRLPCPLPRRDLDRGK